MNAAIVVGCRPNFVKAVPVYQALKERGHNPVIIHTGQHSDAVMGMDISRYFGVTVKHLLNLEDGFNRRARRDIRLGDMTARVGFAMDGEEPAVAIVPGDTDSTLAGALAAQMLGIPVAHVEAGLRSYDRSMPEETNRVVVDHIAAVHYITEIQAADNLKAEGIKEQSIVFAGNTMIDSLKRTLDDLGGLSGIKTHYALCTLHRPSNVDSPLNLAPILSALNRIASDVMPVHLVLHPRAMERIRSTYSTSQIIFRDPEPYRSFIALMRDARIVLTDSGGVQEETTYLGIPCLTLRPNTERPVTCELGTNQVVGTDPNKIFESFRAVARHSKVGALPPMWDGQAGVRIARDLEERYADV